MRSLANNGTHFENIIERQQLHQYSYCVRFLIVRIFAKCQRQILYEFTKKIDSNLQPKIVETFYRGTCFRFIFYLMVAKCNKFWEENEWMQNSNFVSDSLRRRLTRSHLNKTRILSSLNLAEGQISAKYSYWLKSPQLHNMQCNTAVVRFIYL